MKKALAVIVFIGIAALGMAQEKRAVNPEYDARLAAKVGADEIGMRNYVMAFLKSGPVKLTDSTERANLMSAHLKNIGRMADEGKLILAGPFTDNGTIRGIYLFNVATLDEAKALTETDPAIQRGTLVMELHPWYGSAALMELPAIHQKVSEKDL
jgi:uncharacterized protein YciI